DLNSFGDAEVAALVAPRRLVALSQPSGLVDLKSADLEAKRARRFYEGLGLAERLEVAPAEKALAAGAEKIAGLLGADRIATDEVLSFRTTKYQVAEARDQHFQALYSYLQNLCEASARVGDAYWNRTTVKPDERGERVQALNAELARLMGTVSTEGVPLNPRTRLI